MTFYVYHFCIFSIDFTKIELNNKKTYSSFKCKNRKMYNIMYIDLIISLRKK